MCKKYHLSSEGSLTYAEALAVYVPILGVFTEPSETIHLGSARVVIGSVGSEDAIEGWVMTFMTVAY